MEYTQYNQKVQRYLNNLAVFPGITNLDKKTYIIKQYDTLYFLIRNEVID